MVAQTSYETLVDDFYKLLAEDGLELRNCGGTLYTYSGGAWGVISAEQTAQFEKYIYAAGLELGFPISEKIKPVWTTVRLRAPLLDADQLDERVYLALPNGTLDPEHDTMYEHDADHMTTRRIAIEYDPDAECPKWLEMLDRVFADKSEVSREEHITFLQEFFGMALCGFKPGSPRSLRKALILYGESGTAKTSIAEVLRQFYVPGEVCDENVDQLSKDYGLARLVSARALIADDAVAKKSRTDPKTLKKIITGEPMAANRKYKDAQSFRFRGPVVFTTNVRPDIKDETDALFGRTVLLVFDRFFTEEDKEALGKFREAVPFLQHHGEFPGILNWSLQGMKRALELKHYSAVAEASESSRSWRADNDVVFDFLTKYATHDKKMFCSVPMLARVVSLYAEVEHHAGRDEYPPKRTAGRLIREVAVSVPGAKLDKYERKDVSGNVFVGLKISDEGLAWEKQTRERGMIPPGTRWQINGRVL